MRVYILAVVPQHMYDEVLHFDELRRKVKKARALNKTSPKILQRYKSVSAVLRENLIKELQESRAALMECQRNTEVTPTTGDTRFSTIHSILRWE